MLKIAARLTLTSFQNKILTNHTSSFWTKMILFGHILV